MTPLRAIVTAALGLVLSAAAQAGESKRSESSEPVHVVGVRGLDKNKAATDTAARDYPAVDRLETVKVTPEELKQFLQEGNLP